ncbi:MAG TPA: M23 family metallopeptidase [Thermoleophilia bacterium]
MSERDRRAGARLRSGARLLVATAALAGVLAAGSAVSVVTLSAQAAPARPAPSPLSTFLPERALAADTSGTSAGVDRALSPVGARFASQPGSGGWYWPTGTEDFGGYSGFLAPRGAYDHIAQDMRSPQGHPVYAIGSGTVWISRADTGGYGVGGAPGGCMIVVHRTATGKAFRALYGHISGLRYEAGAHVTAGAVIATINGCAHLHFSIHPSAVYRDGNPYAGHVPRSWTDHGGFVDPVKYLKANPRVATYQPPALPIVRITTRSAPDRIGAAAGFAYWDEQVGGGAVTYSYDLLGGTRRQLAADETAPSFDDVRYAARLLAAPGLGLSVRDRQPALVAEANPVTPAWGTAARLSATLTNAAAKPFKGARIVLQRLTTDAAWERVAARLTNDTGRVAFAYAPARRTVLRVQFLLPVTQPAQATYVPAESVVVTVVPKVRLSVPAIPATVRRGHMVAVSGTLTPRHARGTGSVRLEFQRHTIGGAWVTALTTDVALSDRPGGSRYSRAVRLGSAGAWRVRAVHPSDAAHAATAGRWRAFTVE